MKIDKVILTIFLGTFLMIGVSVYLVNHAINEAGGIKQIIIDTGKEIKDINRQINED